MIRFSEEKVLLLHQLMIAKTGGAADLRDIRLLDSALESIFQTFDGQELYPTKEEKGARLGFSLISNHAFVDGNKRIGIRLDCTNEDVVSAGLGVASGKMDYEQLLAWVRRHRI